MIRFKPRMVKFFFYNEWKKQRRWWWWRCSTITKASLGSYARLFSFAIPYRDSFFFPLSFQFPRGSKFVLSSIIYRTIVDYTRDRNIGTSSLCLPQGKYSGKGGIFEERDMTLICLQESWNRKINIFPLSSNSFQDKILPATRIVLQIARIFISPPLYFSFSNHVIKVTDAAISLRVLLRWKKRVWLYTPDLIKPYRRLARSGITRVSRSPSWRVTIALPRESSTYFSLCRPSIRLYAKKDAEWDHRGNINDLRCWSEPAWRRSTL